MLKTKVNISKVNNLTDARYFAAMEVDYLGFCCNLDTEKYCSPARIKEITDWVSGPSFVLEFDGYQNQEDIHSILSLGLGTSVHLGAFADYDTPFTVPVFKDYIFENITLQDLDKYDYPVIRSDKRFGQFTDEELSKMVTYFEHKECFLDINIAPDDVALILAHLPVYGILLRGGEEERVGFKSFDQLDEIFDHLTI
jgi:phosphoribosylanthranilate isomerase